MSVTRKIYQKDENGNFVEVADIGALAKFILFEELNDDNQPATAVEIVARLRKELAYEILTEATTRMTNDNTEKTARETKDNELQAAISKEVSDRTDAVSGEKTARESADSTLQTNINNEKSARENADSTLQTNINNEKSARETGDTNTLSSAKSYTDEKIGNLGTQENMVAYALSKLDEAKSYANTEVLNDAKSYADTAADAGVSKAIADNNGAIIKAIKDTNSALRKALDALYKTT